jgi:hypothetical protein
MAFALPHAALSDKRTEAATQKLGEKIAHPIERCLNEDLEQHHLDDGERDRAHRKDLLMCVRS